MSTMLRAGMRALAGLARQRTALDSAAECAGHVRCLRTVRPYMLAHAVAMRDMRQARRPRHASHGASNYGNREVVAMLRHRGTACQKLPTFRPDMQLAEPAAVAALSGRTAPQLHWGTAPSRLPHSGFTGK
jgi:hypothetical protein